MYDKMRSNQTNLHKTMEDPFENEHKLKLICSSVCFSTVLLFICNVILEILMQKGAKLITIL